MNNIAKECYRVNSVLFENCNMLNVYFNSANIHYIVFNVKQNDVQCISISYKFTLFIDLLVKMCFLKTSWLIRHVTQSCLNISLCFPEIQRNLFVISSSLLGTLAVPHRLCELTYKLQASYLIVKTFDYTVDQTMR